MTRLPAILRIITRLDGFLSLFSLLARSSQQFVVNRMSVRLTGLTTLVDGKTPCSKLDDDRYDAHGSLTSTACFLITPTSIEHSSSF
jgi:hypothetical protein